MPYPPRITKSRATWYAAPSRGAKERQSVYTSDEGSPTLDEGTIRDWNSGSTIGVTCCAFVLIWPFESLDTLIWSLIGSVEAYVLCRAYCGWLTSHRNPKISVRRVVAFQVSWMNRSWLR